MIILYGVKIENEFFYSLQGSYCILDEVVKPAQGRRPVKMSTV
jgi:hypothetical protein